MSSPRDVPVDYGFRDVTAPDSAFSEGRALEQIHKLLQAEPGERFAVRNSALSVAGSRAAGPLMILGIMSGHEGRRRVLRCTWGRAPEVRKYLRVLFVVGSMEPLKSEWEFEPAQQVSDPGSIARLRVNISEGVRVWKARPGSRQADRKHQSFTGTFSTYFKQAAFLRFAATQPEPLIGRADDDAFISPHMLLSYAHLLSTLKHPLYGGVFEWISWRAAKLEATGFSYGLSEARGRAKAPHRNCSREVPDAESPAYDHACLGPFACTRALASFASLLLAQLPLFSSDLALASALLLSCAAHALPSVSRALLHLVASDAKGPLLVMNQKALAWLIRAPIFHRDLQRAHDMASGRAPTRKGRIDDDINLGYWMVRMPELRIVRFRRVVWKDTWRDGSDPAMLLAAHKLPWSLHAEVLNTTMRMWQSAPAAQITALCRAVVPPCTSCSHARSQRACVVEIGLETMETSPACIRAPKKGMGCPTFVRESHPGEELYC